ncbi:hypothetical protein QJS04_geneDACA006192 [Acorus gramineus]|uniref:Uncharacterized protein n=1 Tax=Acorus gramineus TaxID=55184 RepID=A0AAV9AX05_ACOGR|nr:hypothetical protein QJS04_geneDACA006192 [Acorus gramineus]
MKASLKGKYEVEKGSAAATLTIPAAGDAKLRASFTDATFSKGPSLDGLSLSLDKPGSFIIDYNVPKNDFRFQFMNTIRVFEKPVNLTYMHRTTLDGLVVFDPVNKVSASYAFGGGAKVKYVYSHGGGRRTFEPCYDTEKDSWDFAVSHKIYAEDVVRASYQTSSKVLGIDWSRNSKVGGSFKVILSFFNVKVSLFLVYVCELACMLGCV